MPKRVTKGNLWGFIQSRPYVSVADIRRLFLMDVEDAAGVSTSEGTYFIGLPREAADLIRQLWHEGRIVLDVNPDVKARVVQGVYPARAPAGRQAQSGQGGLQGQVRPPAPAATDEGSLPRGAGIASEPAGQAAKSGTGKRRRRRKRRGGTADANAPALESPAETRDLTASAIS